MMHDVARPGKEEPIWAEELWEAPYWVIDALPSQVPDQPEGQFFEVEQMLLAGKRHARLRRSFAEVLAKLSCYYDFKVYRGGKDKTVMRPKPDKLRKWVVANKGHLCVSVGTTGAMVELPTDSISMTLYAPTPELLDLVRQLASAAGLFVWQPPAADGNRDAQPPCR